MIMGESVNAEQILEDVERRRQIWSAVKFAGMVVGMVFYIIIFF